MKSPVTTLLLLADIHIPPDDKKMYGIDIKKSFLTVMEKLKEEKADYIIINGDLSCLDGETLCYSWIKEQLDVLKTSCLISPGNHDILENMKKVFDLDHFIKTDGLYYTVELDSYILLFLDSSSYFLPEKQLDYLVKQDKKAAKPILLFIHHPPALCGVRYMDTNYPLKNISQVQQYLKKCTGIAHIFSGHYHREKHLEAAGIPLHLIPSTWYQMADDSTEFSIDSYKKGYMKIIIRNGKINFETIYCD